MKAPAYARARLLIGALFLGAYTLQLVILLTVLVQKGIYLEDLARGIKVMTTVYAPPLGIIAATIFAKPVKPTAGRAPAGPFGAALSVCFLWNAVLCCLTTMFAFGEWRIETFLPTTRDVGMDSAWLTSGALAFFFAKSPE